MPEQSGGSGNIGQRVLVEMPAPPVHGETVFGKEMLATGPGAGWSARPIPDAELGTLFSGPPQGGTRTN